jgi:hypothetical protein
MSSSQPDVIDTRDMVVVDTAFRREFRLAPGLVRGVADGDVEHLSAEEEQLLPIAARHVTAAEWQRLGEEGMAGVRQSQLPLAFGMMQYEGDPEALAEMLSHAPLLARLLMPVLAPRAFARYSKRVHGTATP